MWDKEIYPSEVREYLGDNQGYFTGNYPAVRNIARIAQITASKMVETCKVYARMIKNVQKEMHDTGETSAYHTKAMQTMGSHMQAASKEMALRFMDNNRTTFHMMSDSEAQKIYLDLQKEFYALQQLFANVAGLLINGDEAVYGHGAHEIHFQHEHKEHMEKVTKGLKKHGHSDHH